MTTWIIGAFRPTAGQTAHAGFETSYEDTGLRYDETVTLKSWTPAVASSKSLQVQKVLRAFAEGFAQSGTELGAGWLYCADNQAGTIVYANRDPL